MFKKDINKQALMLIKIDHIDLNPYQIRKKVNYTQLKDLSDSISNVGLLQPITVNKQKRGRYQLVSGERRLYALKQAGITDVYAKVIKVDEMDLALNVFIENIHIQPYHVIDKAEAMLLFVDKFKILPEELSRKTGLMQCTIQCLLLIGKLHPKIKKQLYHQTDAEKWAMALIKIKDQQAQKQIMSIAVEKNFNTVQFLNLIKQTEKAMNHRMNLGPKVIKNIATNQVFINSIESLVNEIKQCGYEAEIIRTETVDKTKVVINMSNMAKKQKIS